MLDSNHTTTHLTGAFGLDVSRALAGTLRLGAVTRAALLFPPFRTGCEDCALPRGDMIPAFDFGLMISF
jgi:hypothetical protein